MRKRKRIQRRSSTGKGWTTRRKEKALAKLGLSTGSPESSGEGGILCRGRWQQSQMNTLPISIRGLREKSTEAK